MTRRCYLDASALHVPIPVVKLDGTKRSRTFSKAIDVVSRTTHSSPGGHRKIFLKNLDTDDPRAPVRLPSHRGLASFALSRQGAVDNAGIALDDTAWPVLQPDSDAEHATSSIAAPTLDIQHCNTDTAVEPAGTAVRTPSTDNVAVARCADPTVDLPPL